MSLLYEKNHIERSVEYYCGCISISFWDEYINVLNIPTRYLLISIIDLGFLVSARPETAVSIWQLPGRGLCRISGKAY